MPTKYVISHEIDIILNVIYFLEANKKELNCFKLIIIHLNICIKLLILIIIIIQNSCKRSDKNYYCMLKFLYKSFPMNIKLLSWSLPVYFFLGNLTTYHSIEIKYKHSFFTLWDVDCNIPLNFNQFSFFLLHFAIFFFLNCRSI